MKRQKDKDKRKRQNNNKKLQKYYYLNRIDFKIKKWWCKIEKVDSYAKIDKKF